VTRTRVKICGITSLEDAVAACAAGVDWIGFVFADSPRAVTPKHARTIVERLPRPVRTVGVLRDAPLEQARRAAARSGVEWIQLHGSETPEYCLDLGWPVIKRFHVVDGDDRNSLRDRMRRYRPQAWLVDPGAGDGRPFRWSVARGTVDRLIVAGGLTPDNVAQAVREARPFAVDAASGVESAPGRKDRERMEQFVRQVRREDERLAAE
jgi:phosphoribosylanthranilate isomerase